MRKGNIYLSFRLMKLVSPMLVIMLAAILMGVVGFLCAIFIPILGIIAFINPDITSTIFITIIVMALLRGILRYIEQSCNHYIAFKLLAHIRDEIFTALRKLCPAKLETKNKGDLISIITSDIELLEVFYAHTISPVAIAIITSILMIIFMAHYHFLFAITALIAYIVVGLVIPFTIGKLAGNQGLVYREKTGVLSSFVLEMTRGIYEIIQYNGGNDKINTLKKETDNLNNYQSQLRQYEGITTALTSTIIIVFTFIILLIGITLYNNNIIEFNEVIIPMVAMISSFGPVIALSNLANNLVHTFASAKRVIAILDETPQVTEVTDGQGGKFETLECNDITFAYNDEDILNKFNLKLNKNEIVGIIGKSGSGKSTLLRLLMRFWDVNKGSISISDTNIKDWNTSSLRDIESFVTQDTELFHDSIANNIRIGKLDATDDEIIDACKKASIHEFITSLPKGYDTEVGELGNTLSGGEKQRIGLARAFLHNSELILLDEPTSNLDSLNEAIILKSLSEVTDKTIVLVTHRQSTMAITDRIIRMNEERES